MSDPRASQLEQAALGNPKVNQTSNHNILLFGSRSSQFYFVISTGPESSGSTILAYAAAVLFRTFKCSKFYDFGRRRLYGKNRIAFRIHDIFKPTISPAFPKFFALGIPGWDSKGYLHVMMKKSMNELAKSVNGSL